MSRRMLVPPLKSQGIKTKLVPWIQQVVGRLDGRWIEPFLGTGVVAFNVAGPDALLGDANPHIIRFYEDVRCGRVRPETVRRYLEYEGRRLRDADEGGDTHYRRIRDRFNRDHDSLDFLFLSRAGFNGMMRFNRQGAWNIPFCKKPARFRPAYVTKIVNQVRAVADRVQPGWRFVNEPFERVVSRAGPGDLLYCDPPYLGRHVDYYNGWSEADEARLFALLSETPARFVLSTWHHNAHRENPMIGRFWRGFRIVTRDHFYHTGARLENRRPMVEALVCNFP